MNRSLPSGDRGRRISDPRRESGVAGAVPRTCRLVWRIEAAAGEANEGKPPRQQPGGWRKFGLRAAGLDQIALQPIISFGRYDRQPFAVSRNVGGLAAFSAGAAFVANLGLEGATRSPCGAMLAFCGGTGGFRLAG